MIGRVVTSLPSPSDGTIDIGPLSIHAYGLMIALGVIAGVRLLGRRMVAKGVGTAEDASSIAVWGVVGGVIGSRLYHVATDWSKFSNNLGAIPQIWKGGLGIPGGLLVGVAAGIIAVRKRNLQISAVLGCAAPAIPLAQAIGRCGNWFNQELFGRPTTLPWGLRIDAQHRPAEYANSPTFHPTFLYESLANVLLCVMLIVLDRRKSIRPGNLFALYLGGYGAIRFFVEGMRIDEAHKVGGLRWNQWVALAAVLGAAAYLVVKRNQLQPATTAALANDEPANDEPANDEPANDAPVNDAPANESPSPDLATALQEPRELPD